MNWRSIESSAVRCIISARFRARALNTLCFSIPEVVVFVIVVVAVVVGVVVDLAVAVAVAYDVADAADYAAIDTLDFPGISFFFVKKK